MKKVWTVYKHTNKINGKCYIGISNQKYVKNRWGKNGNRYNQPGQKKFWSAIVKYGWDNFEHEILETGIETPELANEREKYWIEYYDSFKHGYNGTLGGSGATGHILSEEKKKEMGIANIGSKHHTQKHSEETKKRLSTIQKNLHHSPKTEFKKGHIMSETTRKKLSIIGKGRKLSKEAKEKISKKNKLHVGANNKRSKPILQYDLNMNFIKEWPSAHEIKEELGFDRSSIARCCRGEYRQLKGFIWKYK